MNKYVHSKFEKNPKLGNPFEVEYKLSKHFFTSFIEDSFDSINEYDICFGKKSLNGTVERYFNVLEFIVA